MARFQFWQGLLMMAMVAATTCIEWTTADVSSDVPGDEAHHKALQTLRKVVSPLPNVILER